MRAWKKRQRTSGWEDRWKEEGEERLTRRTFTALTDFDGEDSRSNKGNGRGERNLGEGGDRREENGGKNKRGRKEGFEKEEKEKRRCGRERKRRTRKRKHES